MNCQNKSCQYYCAGQCVQAWSVSIDEVGQCKQYSYSTTNYLYAPKDPNLYTLRSQSSMQHKDQGGFKDE